MISIMLFSLAINIAFYFLFDRYILDRDDDEDIKLNLMLVSLLGLAIVMFVKNPSITTIAVYCYTFIIGKPLGYIADSKVEDWFNGYE